MSHAMKHPAILALTLVAATSSAQAQQSSPPAGPRPYTVGNPIGLPVITTPEAPFKPVSKNVKVFGSVYAAESCTYDPDRGVIVLPNRGVPPNVQGNNAWITLLNHDGSVHTSRWIGVQNPGVQRDSMSPRLVLNEPFGSDIMNGVLYLADRDGDTGPNDPPVTAVRRFDLKTGAPLGDFKVPAAAYFNDIAVTKDGTIYGTVTGASQLWRINPDGQASIWVSAAPLNRPNGVAIDNQGNIVVVNIGDDAVLTFAPDGKVLQTERAVQAGNDGIVIMKDGTKYVSSVINGGISQIRPGKPATLIAENVPSAASMCYDSGAKQLVIPMNANNAVAFIKVP